MTEKKHPFNPYYLGVWYAGYLFAVSTTILSLRVDSVHYIYIFLQSLGAENLLLSSRRLNSMHQYLIENGRQVRWEHLTCYYTALCIGFIITIFVSTIAANRYLDWYRTVNDTWSRPMIQEGRKFLWRSLAFAIFGSLIILQRQVYYISHWDKIGRGVDNIQSSDFGYFHVAISTALTIGAIQYIHFAIYRFWRNYQLVTRLTAISNKGE